MSAIYSPSRSSAVSRMQLIGPNASRLRSSSSKKPPEPLRRAVADCLSSASPPHLEASRTLQDYLATQTTVDLAYGVILEHTLAERERSPAVVARCVALLKRYLLRYKPSEETLQLIDRFCTSIIAECDVGTYRKMAPWSHSLSQQSPASAPSTFVTPFPVSTFASGALVKSLNYVRSLVAQYIPKRSFQPAVFAGAATASRQSLPTLSSLLSKSFNSQLSPANAKEMDSKESSLTSVAESQNTEEADEHGDQEFITLDIFRWRWRGDQQSLLLMPESDRILGPSGMQTLNFLEIGAAALLVGDMEAKMKGEAWGTSGGADMAYLDQLLRPSLLTTITNSNSAIAHLRAIAALKRSKTGTNQIWEDSPLNTLRPRARPLFQYRHYSEQQPLKLNSVEVCEVIAAVCSESDVDSNVSTVSSKLRRSGRPSMDVAVSVLVKLVIDMYVLDSEIAGPLTLSLLEDMLTSPTVMSKTRAFDLIINLGVHAHLLEPPAPDVTTAIEEQLSQEAFSDSGTQDSLHRESRSDKHKTENLAATNRFECWILGILYELLLHLVQVEEKQEAVWASALSCLLYFVCDRGEIRRSRLKGLDIRVIKTLIQISKRNSWVEIVHCKLVCMLTNMFYQVPEGPDKVIPAIPSFLMEQVELIGGIEFIFVEMVQSNSREQRRNLHLVLFDYVLHKINKACTVAGASEYSDEEVRPIVTLLLLAEAPEALRFSVKLGAEGIVELLRRSISAALSNYPNNDRLLMLLEKIVEKFNVLIGSFTHLDKEFTQMIQMTKLFKSTQNIDVRGNLTSMDANLCWTTLHSLLHSHRSAYRHNGYLWLGELLVSEISSEGGGQKLLASIKNLEQKISVAGVNDYSDSLDVPYPVWLMCGLLKLKNSHIRWGFLYVLKRLLMRCKFLLDESEVQHVMNAQSSTNASSGDRLEKANAVIDIMSSALSLMAQRNETDRMNILKMCGILLSQLCLRVPHPSATQHGDMRHPNASVTKSESIKIKATEHFSSMKSISRGDYIGDANSSKTGKIAYSSGCETESMAALLLHGHAIVPMQLVARVPAALFYWPLIQLAAAATDNIALGVSVGSKGRGNLPGGTSDIRAALLLLLIGKCTADPSAFVEVGGEEFFRELLDDTDARVAYYASTFLLKRMMTEEPDKYQRMLHSLVSRAQQINNEKLLENPYLQMRGLLQLSNE